MVSVVIPVHNGERFIDEAIQSVLSQTLKDIELIIVDDGSSDRTAEIASAFTDPRLRLVRESKRGISGAINVGIDLSRAELIACSPSAPMRQMRGIEQRRVSMPFLPSA